MFFSRHVSANPVSKLEQKNSREKINKVSLLINLADSGTLSNHQLHLLRFQREAVKLENQLSGCGSFYGLNGGAEEPQGKILSGAASHVLSRTLPTPVWDPIHLVHKP